MAKRRMTMQVFDVRPRDTKIETPDYSSDLFKLLDGTKSINERFMELHQETGVAAALDEGDFIPYFSFDDDFLFGSFVRIRPGEMTNVTKVQLSQKKVALGDMVTQAEEGSAGSIKEYAFFCMYSNVLIMSSARTNRRSLENYFNWLLREAKKPVSECDFVAQKRTEDQISMGDITDIQIQEGYFQDKAQTPEARSRFLNIKRTLIKSLILDIDGTEDIDFEEILSATLHIKLKRREAKKRNEKSLDTLLKVMDSDDIMIRGRNGRRIRGTAYLVKVVREIEHTGRNFNEPEIDSEMRKILKDVVNGKVVN